MKKVVTKGTNGSYTYDYGAAAELKGWKTLKTNATNVGKATLKWTTKGVQAGSVVLLRKAGAGTTFSSQVQIFKAPTKAGESWKSVGVDEYDTDMSNAKDLPTFTVKYSASADAFAFIASGNASSDATAALVAGKKVTAKVSKNVKEDTASVTDQKSGKTYISVKRVKLPEATSSDQTVTFTVPAGVIEYKVDGQTIPAAAMTFKDVKYKDSDSWD